MDVGTIVVLLLILISTALFYWYYNKNLDYWKKRNIPYVKPLPFLGSILDVVTKPFHEIEDLRRKKHGRIYGHFEGVRAVLSVAEPPLLRDILVKDFHIFPQRRSASTGDEIFDKMMTAATGEDWKRIRTIVTPTFTTGKIRRMINIFKECAETTLQNFKKASEKGDPVELKRIFGGYTMDVIASSAFSTKIDSHNDPENKFVIAARDVFRISFNWRFVLFILCPSVLRWLKISLLPPHALRFFRDATLQIIEERKRTGQTRNDFLQLLMDTAKEVSDDRKSELNEKESDDTSAVYGDVDINHHIFKTVTKKHLSVNELVAQCIIFFIAGYDTTASTLSFATYMLALNPDIQDKVYEELVDALQHTNGELTYEALQNMKYLDNVISETLRLYPPAVRVERMAVADYKLGDTGITIPKGMLVTIPAYAMHRDPELYPDPEKFDPDRFTPEERAKRDPYAYLPFGAGPRNCVGMRFALMEIKVCLALVITAFKINRCPQTKVPLEYFIGAGILQPLDVTVALERRKDNPLVQ